MKAPKKFELKAKSLFKWFPDNQMKANRDKCHFHISSTSQSELKIGNETTKSSTCDRILEIKIDNRLRLNAHVEDFCKKANRKIHALARVTSHMTVMKYTSYMKRCFRMNAFFRSQFSYCQLVWIFHSGTLNN